MIHYAREEIFKQHWSVTTLKLLIIGIAAILLFLALTIDNPWLLSLILAYEVLP